MQLSDIRSRVIGRLEWDPSDTNAQAAATAAIGEGQRLFCFLTLSLENQRELVLTPGKSWYRMLDAGWADWLVPLRVRISNDTAAGADMTFDTQESDTGTFNEQASPGLAVNTNPKLRPASLYEMAAADDSFLNTNGTPTQYGVLGWDFLFLNKRPALTGQKLLITYARSPVPLVNDGDVPKILDADHASLIDYGEWRLRANEGGQELASANARLTSYLDNAKERADQVRARSLSQRYDRQPFELESFDYSKLLKTRPDLPPYRKENRWTGQPSPPGSS